MELLEQYLNSINLEQKKSFYFLLLLFSGEIERYLHWSNKFQEAGDLGEKIKVLRPLFSK
jgi:hypothetical protein